LSIQLCQSSKLWQSFFVYIFCELFCHFDEGDSSDSE